MFPYAGLRTGHRTCKKSRKWEKENSTFLIETQILVRNFAPVLPYFPSCEVYSFTAGKVSQLKIICRFDLLQILLNKGFKS